jgi:hypothetical protein
MNNKSLLIFIAISIACLALGVGGVILMKNYVPNLEGQTGKNDSEKAQIRCEEVIKASLRDSLQASFPSQKTTALGDNRYQVTGTVDAPNATGVMVKGNYICIFNFTSKSFDLLSLEGEDIWKPLKK